MIKNTIKDLDVKNMKVDNSNLYLLADEGYGEYYPLAEELETLREGDLCKKIISILKNHKYKYSHKIRNLGDLVNLLSNMDEDARREMGLDRDIIKVGRPHSSDEGDCPYCGSDDVDWGSLEVDDMSDRIYYLCTCNKCGKNFSIWYKPVYIETVKDDQ